MIIILACDRLKNWKSWVNGVNQYRVRVMIINEGSESEGKERKKGRNKEATKTIITII